MVAFISSSSQIRREEEGVFYSVAPFGGMWNVAPTPLKVASARFSENTKEGGFPSGSVGFHKYGGRVSPTLWPHLGHLLNCLAKIPGSVGFHKYGGRRVSPTLCPIWEVRCSKRQQSKGGEGGGEHSRIAKIPGGYPICSVVGVRILHTFIETSYIPL